MNKAYTLARKDEGTWEWRDGHNPKVVQYFADVGHAWVKDDETAWCAAFVGAMLKRAGMPHTGQLNARSYLNWGEPVALEDAQEGDIAVFSRGDPNGWKGHVAFYVSHKGAHISVLGGNQDNQVNEKNYAKSRLLGIRRMANTAKPSISQLPKPVQELVDDANKSSAGSSTNIAAVVSGGTGIITAVSALDPIVAVAVVALIGLGVFWIIKERRKKSGMAKDVLKVFGDV